MTGVIVLRGGRVLDPSQGLDEQADVVIEAGRIKELGRDAGAAHQAGDAVRIVDASGHWVCPGFVDLHVHLREPGQEYKEDIGSGLDAAAAGGFTAVCPMPNTKPTNDTRAITEMMISRAKEHGGARLMPFGAVTRGQRGTELTEMADLREAGAIGVSDDGVCVMNAAVMRHGMEYARTFDLLVSQHCEDHDLTHGAQMHEGARSTQLGLRGWPRAAEDIIVARDLILAETTGARYHVAHISSFGAVRLIREAKSRGLRVSAEVTPHHLLFTDEALLSYDTYCKVNPPLREAEDLEALREAIADGTIDCIATDHAPHSELEKDCEFEAASVGINGLETAIGSMFQLVRSGALKPLRFVEALSTAPARLLPDFEGGSLKVGRRADITVLDPDARWILDKEALRSKSHNTPLLGRELTGRPVMTMVDGKVVYELGT
ncbi:MAG: dihydroorotase [Deltaproteobacteria bacterium]|nr:dihydroorotase [Deltaproteobacteria bacterium]NND27619.1 dihydroorotase [Myxococcales bacterium]MBT8465083.1 dihydroorotase [Deltaproteobacteria bacterium]MBT8481951.1 dihydroorotase [Deltaproteobacteria bacterium]NNK41340.1 dihydroorotase [Myxococcales bacterium]